MRHLLSLSGLSRHDLSDIFARAKSFEGGRGPIMDGAAALFFPASSVRTRVSFERGAAEMGLQPIVFPPETLDKDEDPIDVVGYLASWVDLLVVRHPDIEVLRGLAGAETLPVINAMTNVNHPCEVLSDLYALAQDADPFGLKFLFVGADGNIARAWWEAGVAFGIDIEQSCPAELRVPGMPWNEDLRDAMRGADVVITDGPGRDADALAPYRVTGELLDTAPDNVRFAPCPPFIRGREVSEDAVDHPSFVGYRFKRHLTTVQQAVMSRALET
ncbi:ornithine carbamoyltransferase [Microbacterium sp. 2MCAF23]|uniref:ornithine carbamoyltransferase n=1 Tax=Microbacterium sp. 2MCAF23 TaxID=3232985 RepID=UPI003F9574E7